MSEQRQPGPRRTRRDDGVLTRPRSARSTADRRWRPDGPGAGHRGEKSLNFGPSLQRLLGHLAPERMDPDRRASPWRSIGIVLERHRPEDPRLGHQRDLRRRHRQAARRPGRPRSRSSRSCAPGQRHVRRHGAATRRHARRRASTSTLLGTAAAGRPGALRGRSPAAVAAGLPAERGRAAVDLPAAQPGRGQDQPAAAALLRPVSRAASC